MVRSGDYDLPADDHIGLFVITFPTPPSYTASSVSCKSGEIVTSGSMAHKAIATVLQKIVTKRLDRNNNNTYFRPR